MSLISLCKSVFAFLLLTNIPNCQFEPKWHQPETPAKLRLVLGLEDCGNEQLENKMLMMEQLFSERLKDNRVFYKSVSSDINKKEFTLDIIKLADETNSIQKVRKYLVQNVGLEMVTAYQVKDQIIKSWIENDLKKDSVENMIDLNYIQGSQYRKYPEAVILACKKENLAQLKEVIAKHERTTDIAFRWGENKGIFQDDPNPYAYLLYGFNKRNKDRITSKHITEASPTPSQYTGQIEIIVKMNKEGAEAFGKMTEKAANDGNREILIMLNDEVYSAPRVNEGIYGGSCSISGNFELEEAEQLANLLNSQALPCEVKILSENAIAE